MKWRVQQSVIRGTGPAKWIDLGTVEADSKDDVWAFAEKEWGLTDSDIYSVTAIIKEGHAQYLYKAVSEFLAEIENDEMYPETTAVEWMRHAISLIEEHDNTEEKEVRRV